MAITCTGTRRARASTLGVLLEVGMSEDQVQALVDSQPT
jgi:hypothetical protein